MKFELGPGVRCDLQKLIDTRALVQANSGGGKSHTLRRLLEQTHGKVQQLVIDPEGEFASLRERYDYVLAARTGGDTAADPRAAKLLAERLLQLGVSAILDIYELKAHERIRFVRHFLEALVDAPKTLWHPALVVVDEAHVFCPQQGEAESAGAVIDLCTRGRKRGFSAILATQRLSKLHKDAAAELNNKLIGRTGLDVDRKRAGEELGFTTKEQLLSLRQLEPGAFYAFGPALSLEVVQVQVGPVQTTHPKAGSRIAFTPPPPTDKVRALLPQLADLPAEAEQKQRSEAELKKDLAAARATITRLERAAPLRVETKVETKTERVMVPMLTEDHLHELQAAARTIQETFAGARGLVEQMTENLGALTKALRTIDMAIAQATAPRPVQTRPREVPVRIDERGGVHETTLTARQRKGTTIRDLGARAEDGTLTGVEQRILNALAELEALGATSPPRELVCFLSGYANLKSKGFSNGCGALRSSGRITYTADGRVLLTDQGRALAEQAGAPRTPAELQERILAQLGTTVARVLVPLIEAYPGTVLKADLLEASGYGNVKSKGFSNNLGRLRTLGFVEYVGTGEVRATPVLFLEGAA